MDLRKFLTWVGVALLLFFLIAQPQQAAGLVSHILTLLKNGAAAIITFVKTLVSGSGHSSAAGLPGFRHLN